MNYRGYIKYFYDRDDGVGGFLNLTRASRLSCIYNALVSPSPDLRLWEMYILRTVRYSILTFIVLCLGFRICYFSPYLFPERTPDTALKHNASAIARTARNSRPKGRNLCSRYC